MEQPSETDGAAVSPSPPQSGLITAELRAFAHACAAPAPVGPVPPIAVTATAVISQIEEPARAVGSDDKDAAMRIATPPAPPCISSSSAAAEARQPVEEAKQADQLPPAPQQPRKTAQVVDLTMESTSEEEDDEDDYEEEDEDESGDRDEEEEWQEDAEDMEYEESVDDDDDATVSDAGTTRSCSSSSSVRLPAVAKKRTGAASQGGSRLGRGCRRPVAKRRWPGDEEEDHHDHKAMPRRRGRSERAAKQGSRALPEAPPQRSFVNRRFPCTACGWMIGGTE